MVVKADITIDIDKQVGNLQNLTNIYNARVGDSNTPLTVLWQKNGIALNLQGLHAFIAGKVGDGYYNAETDTIDFPVGSPVVKYEDDGSGTLNNGQSGLTTLLIPQQMWAKTGLFAGYIGLKDNNGSVFTSKDIFFKVLGNVLDAGIEVNYFIDDFDKALAKAKADTQNVIDDARNTYESETKNAHDALDALNSQIQANRDEQQNLTQRLAGTEQQITTHDVVTRPEFLDLGNRLNQQVANLRQNKTLYFQNEAELKSKYPSGTDNLCVTLDTKHLWVYDYANGVWADAGATNIVSADPETEDAIYTDSSNLAPDPDFKIMDSEWSFGRDLGTPDWAFEPETVNNSKVIQMHGYYNQATENNSNNTWIRSRNINITGQKALSIGWEINAKSAGQPIDAHTEIQIEFIDNNGKSITYQGYKVPESQDDILHLLKWENLTPPANAVSAALSVLIQGTGSVRFTRPRFNFASTILPYDIKDTIDHIQPINTHTSTSNLVPNANLTNLDLWNISIDVGKTNYQLLDQKLNTSNIIRLYGHNAAGPGDYGNQCLASSNFKIKGAKALSLSWMVRSNLDDLSTGNFQLSVAFLDQNLNVIPPDSKTAINQNTTDFKLFSVENILVPDTAVYANVYIIIHGSGYIDLAYPQVNAGEKVLPYSETRLLSAYANTSDNLVPNANLIDLKDWSYDNDTHTAKVDELSQTFSGSHIARLYGHNKDLKNTFDDGNAWFSSAEFNVQMFQKLYCDFSLKINLDDPNTGMINIGTAFYDENNKKIATDAKPVFPVTGNTPLFFKANQECDVPESAVYASVYVLIQGSGYVDIANPVVTGTGASASNNLINSLFQHQGTIQFSKDLGGNVPRQITDDYLSFDGFHSDETNNNWNNTVVTLGSLKIPQSSKYISLDINILIQLLQGTDDNNLRLDLDTYDTIGNLLSSKRKLLNKNIDDFSHVYWEGIWLPDNADTFSIAFTLHNKGTIKIANIDYKFNDVYEQTNLPKLFVNNANDVNDQWQNAQFRYIDGSRTLNGYLKFSIQGDSSRSYPKKNFKTKFFKDNEYKNKLNWKPKSNWQANNKFNFKANWIDATQSRNLVNAQMIEKATAITPMEKQDVTSDLLKSQGLGQMEGFPVEVYLADGYYGLFTLNTKKDDKTFGMDSDKPEHEVISVELAKQVFRDPKATIDEVNYLTEIHDKPSANLQSNFEKFVQFINNSSAEDFTNHLSDYIDVKSCINTMLYGILSKEYDYYSKSFLLCTWNDGSYFYMVPYDLDSTWGLLWNGSKIVGDENDAWFSFDGLIKTDPNQDNFISNHGQNRLFERIYEHLKPQVKEQYDLLRSSIWKNSDIIQAFKQFINAIPKAAYEKEQARWPELPSKDFTDFEQIQQFVIERANKMDDFMTNNFYRETDPIQNLQSQIDQLKNSGTTQK